METITFERESINFDGLFAELKTVFGELVAAISAGRGQVAVHLTAAPTPEQEMQLREVVREHNPANLTPEQQAAAARRTHAADTRARFANSALANRSPQQIYDTLTARINGWSSLADAKSDLAAWLPLLAAAVAWLVVEE